MLRPWEETHRDPETTGRKKQRETVREIEIQPAHHPSWVQPQPTGQLNTCMWMTLPAGATEEWSSGAPSDWRAVRRHWQLFAVRLLWVVSYRAKADQSSGGVGLKPAALALMDICFSPWAHKLLGKVERKESSDTWAPLNVVLHLTLMYCEKGKS